MGLTLYGQPGWGSVLVEAQLVWYERPFAFVATGDLFESAEARELVLPFNPLAQVPTLVLDDGTVLTESAAITLALADESPDHQCLVPGASSHERTPFLRWLLFITSNIYPTYTFGDDPARFVPDPKAREGFRERVDSYAQKLYGILDEAAASPWFLGERFTALDIYVKTLTHWRPGRKWFERETPKLVAIADRVADLDPLRITWQRNFPSE